MHENAVAAHVETRDTVKDAGSRSSTWRRSGASKSRRPEEVMNRYGSAVLYVILYQIMCQVGVKVPSSVLAEVSGAVWLAPWPGDQLLCHCRRLARHAKASLPQLVSRCRALVQAQAHRAEVAPANLLRYVQVARHDRFDRLIILASRAQDAAAAERLLEHLSASPSIPGWLQRAREAGERPDAARTLNVRDSGLEARSI